MLTTGRHQDDYTEDELTAMFTSCPHCGCAGMEHGVISPASSLAPEERGCIKCGSHCMNAESETELDTEPEE
jgi:Rieske Fe-S protein